MTSRTTLILFYYIVHLALNCDLFSQISDDFVRPTLSIQMLSFEGEGERAEAMISGLPKAVFDEPVMEKYNFDFNAFTGFQSTMSRDKFLNRSGDVNTISVRDALASGANTKLAKIQWNPNLTAQAVVIQKLVEEKRLASAVMSSWAKLENGRFVNLENRATRNQSFRDDAVFRDPRKYENLEPLLLNNYIVFFNIGKPQIVSSSDTEVNGIERQRENGKIVYSAECVSYVYKINVSPEEFASEIAPNFEIGKTHLIEKYDYKVDFVGSGTSTITFNPSLESDMRGLASLGGTVKQGFSNLVTRTKNARQQGLANRDGTTARLDTIQQIEKVVSFDSLTTLEQERIVDDHMTKETLFKTMFILEKYVADFQIKSALLSSSPVTAPIGIREGVVPDQRYVIYSQKIGSDGEVKQVISGVIRATEKIGDNRLRIKMPDGNPIVTEFKQTYGKKLSPDMIIKQANIFDIQLAAGYQYGYYGKDFPVNGHFSMRVTKNITRAFNRISSKRQDYGVYGFFGFSYATSTAVVSESSRPEKVGSLELEVGLSKALYLNKSFDLVPEIAFMAHAPAIESQDSTPLRLYLFAPGVSVPINVTSSLAVIPSLRIPLIEVTGAVGVQGFAHMALRAGYTF